MALNNHSSRAHAILSASSAHRWLKCPPSATAAMLYDNTDTEYSREGTLAHEVAEIIAKGDTPDLESTTETITPEMIQCGEAYRDYIQELIHDDNAVVLLEQRVDFSPWVPGGFGTCDCIILQGNRLDIVDYKFGKGVAVSAEENPQMRLYGLGALNDFGAIYDIHEIGMHIFQPRMNNISVDALLVAGILDWGREIAPIAEKAADGKGDHCAGEHCRFCPHAGACPTISAACLKVVNAHGGKIAVPTLAPWMIADILREESMISAWLKAVKERALATMMDGEEVPGFKVVEGRGSREWTDAVLTDLRLSEHYSVSEYTETKLLSPYALEQSIGKKKVQELLADLITTKPGNPTIAPASDKRKPYDRQEASRKAFE